MYKTTRYKLLLLFIFAFSYTYSSFSEEKRPNIVYIMTDDQRWDNFGCYGRPEFETTNIDKLAAEGVIFDNVYYTVSICAPSRVSVLTGRYFASHKGGFTYPFDRKIDKKDLDNSYPAILRKAGYRTGFVGKFGVYTKKEEVDLHDYFDFYAGSGGTWSEDTKTIQGIRSRKTDPATYTAVMRKTDLMLNFLETQPKDKPFCISISYDAVKNDSDKSLYVPHTKVFENKTMTVPENWVEGLNESFPKVLKENARGVNLHGHFTSTPEKYQKLAKRFATQGYTVDQQVARVVDKLKEMGVLENTVIIYTSDNGRFHGSHGLYDKAILYDEAVKAPLIIYDGRLPQKSRGRRESALISFADIAPTIVSLANEKAPTAMQGMDFSPMLKKKQKKSAWRDIVFMENLFLQEMHRANAVLKLKNLDEINAKLVAENKSYRSRGVRTERYKYFVYYEHTPVIEELYDLDKDPSEMNNLINDAKYAKTLAEMRTQTEKLYQKFKE